MRLASLFQFSRGPATNGAWALVQSLFSGCGPATIAGLVSTVIVDAIDRVFWRWPPAHIRQEILEGLKPARADRDATLAVATKIGSARIATPFLHTPPCFKLWRVRHAVRGRSSDQLFNSQTATGMGTSQIGTSDAAHSSAFALTEIFRMPWVIRIAFEADDGQAADLSTRGKWRQNHSIMRPYFGLSQPLWC